MSESPPLQGVGVSDTTATQSAADRPRPKRSVGQRRYAEARKTAKTWLLGWSQPIGRKPTTAFPRGRPRGPRGQSKRNPAPAWDELPAVVTRQVDGPARGLESTEGLRPLVVDTARRPVGGPNASDPAWGQPSARKPEYPRGENCHRVWHHRDAHREWNSTAKSVGGGQRGFDEFLSRYV